MEVLIGQMFAGLSLGSVLLLAALGLSLTFGQMGVINMAHGEFMMAGAYTAFVVQRASPTRASHCLFPFRWASSVGGLLGLVLEAVLLRRMYHRPLDTLLVTFGVSLILQQAARDIFGAPSVDVRAPEWLQGNIELLGAPIPMTRLFILLLSLVGVSALVAVLKGTPLGRRIRAVVLNRDLAETSGISSRRTDQLTFFIGSASPASRGWLSP